MTVIMADESERQMAFDRQMAEIDWRSQMLAERQKGTIETLAKLVQQNILSISEAAEEADMTIQEFKKQAWKLAHIRRK